jgi:hypothetical protein
MWIVLILAIYFVVIQVLGSASSGLAASLLIVLVGQWVVGAPMIKLTQWSAANPLVEPFDPWSGDKPQQVIKGIRSDASSMEEIGFRNLVNYRVLHAGPNTEAIATLFENRKERQTAKLFMVMVKAGPVRKSEATLAFTTEFADGTKLTTSNNTTPSIFPPIRIRQGSMSFPRIRDPRKLHEIHRASVARFGGDDERAMPRIEDPLDFVRESMQADTAKFAETGYYYLDGKYDVYRPTWKGAILMTAKSAWPVKQIRSLIRRRRGARLLRELMVEPSYETH